MPDCYCPRCGQKAKSRSHECDPASRLPEATAESVVAAARARGGFLTNAEVDYLAKHDRLRGLIVRCGAGRFMCAAQDVVHFVGIITREGSDYVRDVSLKPDKKAPPYNPSW